MSENAFEPSLSPISSDQSCKRVEKGICAVTRWPQAMLLWTLIISVKSDNKVLSPQGLSKRIQKSWWLLQLQEWLPFLFFWHSFAFIFAYIDFAVLGSNLGPHTGKSLTQFLAPLLTLCFCITPRDAQAHLWSVVCSGLFCPPGHVGGTFAVSGIKLGSVYSLYYLGGGGKIQ